MRILYWSDSYWPNVGGVETFGRNLVRELRERGHVITIVTSSAPGDEDSLGTVDGVDVVRLPMDRALRTSSLEQIFSCRKRLSELKRSFRPDLIHLNTFGPLGVFHLWTQADSPAPTLVSLHNTIETAAARKSTATSIMDRLLGLAARVTGCAEYVVEIARDVHPVTRDKIQVVHYGLPFPETAEFSYPDSPVFLCAGRVIREKGFDTALEAFAKVRANRTDVRMRIVGNGPELGALRDLAGSLGVKNAVEFTGPVDASETQRLMSDVTAVVVPSRGPEGIPLTAIEAGLQGRPVLATTWGGLPEIIQPDINGYLYEPGNSADLADLMMALSDQPDIVRDLGRAARDLAALRFDIKSTTDEFEAIYRSMTSVGTPI
jgi:glycosyltransferase involved in cell wall biosynthesis